MGLVLVIASGKGGVGKSTIAANCGSWLSHLHKNVILIDADCGLRSLDYLLGVTQNIVYDIHDVISGRCSLKDAVVRSEQFPYLSLLPASQSTDAIGLPADEMQKLCRHLSQYYEYIIIDAPAGIGEGFKNAASAADMAAVVATPDIISIHDAEKAGGILKSLGVQKIRLIINKVRPNLVKRGLMANLDDVIDQTGIQLIGIVPDDEEITIAGFKGRINLDQKDQAAKAFHNIARRLAGEYVPLIKL